jgi:homocysteine S-methyltransferase
MPKYRHRLPQLSGGLFLTDGGLETTLIFHDGIELPYFASFDLLKSAEGTAAIRDYYLRYIAIAKRNRTGFVLEGATWRANPDWGEKLGYSREQLAEANRAAVRLMAELRTEYESAQTPIVISANIGPRGDGYRIDKAMTAAEADDYHGWQVSVFDETEADLVSAFTINYAEEGIGVARACRRAGVPCVISFTVETDGKLPSGQTIRDAIEQTDRETGNAPAYYMLNCASHAFCEYAAPRRHLGRAPARPAGKCINAQPCRARCRSRSRHRQPSRSRPALSHAVQEVRTLHGTRRLLRHRPPARRADFSCLCAG